jgi:hypothetical protein
MLYRGTVLDGELVAGRFHSTMAALTGSKRFRGELRLVVFDLPRPNRWNPRGWRPKVSARSA